MQKPPKNSHKFLNKKKYLINNQEMKSQNICPLNSNVVLDYTEVQ